MCEVLGYKVVRLRRVRIMHIRLKGIAPGAWRNLTKEEVRGIKRTKSLKDAPQSGGGQEE